MEPAKSWLHSLRRNDPETLRQISAALDQVAREGPGLGRPLVDTLQGSSIANLKELRPGSTGRTEVRLIFVFDPERSAVVLVGGDKAGSWKSWYPAAINKRRLHTRSIYGGYEKEVNAVAKDNIHLRDPDAISWEELRAEFAFSEEEEEDIARRGEELLAQVRAHRLAELRKRKHVTQVEVAQDMGISQARVSKIERGEISRSEVDTLAAYVKALGGKLQLIANFGDETYVIG